MITKILKTASVIVFILLLASCSNKNQQADSAENARPRQQNSSRSGSQKGKQGPPNFAELLAKMDANKDGKLAKSEVQGRLKDDFSKVDTNSDGFITEAELKNAPKPERGGRRN